MNRDTNERYDLQCLVHSGLYFPPSDRGSCAGEMMEFPNFWRNHHSGDLTGYICQHHAQVFMDRNTHKSPLAQMILSKGFITHA